MIIILAKRIILLHFRSLMIVLAILATAGTLVDLATRHNYISSNFQQTKIASVLFAFSLISNGKKFFNTSTSPNDVSCLHGIRFLSASWVVLGHTYLMGVMQPLWNLVDAYSVRAYQLMEAFYPFFSF